MLYLFRPSIAIIKENNAGRRSCERLPLRAKVFVLLVLELYHLCVLWDNFFFSSSSSLKLFSSLDNKHYSTQHFFSCFSTYICIQSMCQKRLCLHTYVIHFLPFSLQTLILESIFFSHLFQYIFKLDNIFMVVIILHKYLPALIENIF